MPSVIVAWVFSELQGNEPSLNLGRWLRYCQLCTVEAAVLVCFGRTKLLQVITSPMFVKSSDVCSATTKCCYSAFDSAST